jgi:hypothetical protein
MSAATLTIGGHRPCADDALPDDRRSGTSQDARREQRSRQQRRP